MKDDVIKILNDYGIQPSAQRVAVAEYVLATDEHPSADQVFAKVSSNFPMISRATIYNTLNLFVEKVYYANCISQRDVWCSIRI